MSAACRRVVRFYPRPLVFEIYTKISAKMGAFRVFLSLFKHI